MKLRYVGLDVHADSVVIAYADEGEQRAVDVGMVGGATSAVLKALKKLGAGAELRCCYEAGPCGYALKRALDERKIQCTVVAPSLIPQKAGDRVKTDRRDARKLAHLFRGKLLTEVHVPTPETEAVRDLSRAREAISQDKRRSVQRLNHYLLTKGLRFSGKKNTLRFLAWAKEQRGQLKQETERVVLGGLLVEAEHQREREKHADKQLAEVMGTWSLAPVAQALMALRGVQLVTAVAFVAEVGSFMRFAKASQFMSFLGMVPSESSSGGSQRRGGLTRTGNGHLRRLGVQSTWAYQRGAPSSAIRARRRNVSDEVRRIAAKADERLHSKLMRLLHRQLPKPKAIAAVGREFAGFVWAIGRHAELAGKEGQTN